MQILLLTFYRKSFIRVQLREHPRIKEMLSYAMGCPVCGGSFLNMWLECVRFVDSKKVMFWNYAKEKLFNNFCHESQKPPFVATVSQLEKSSDVIFLKSG